MDPIIIVTYLYDIDYIGKMQSRVCMTMVVDVLKQLCAFLFIIFASVLTFSLWGQMYRSLAVILLFYSNVCTYNT